ncbi:hypothetical protein [Natronocalculus amylovorans]|uniref:Uncharacterized protein n=1 Tax=Natronocalculus amylovorans TaxID=2917812 RepID=A0AAE3K824_9EURY|nr:hypothetical protein [Natronocalculus amylovorans]MCL9816581.1 hypothetical protein [Natronocalculus amylovorans]
MVDVSLRDFLTSDRLLLALVLFAGIAGSGVARRLFGEAGFDTVGQVVFIMGYGGMVVVLWYGWLRHIDIRGPEDRDSPDTVENSKLYERESEQAEQSR